jgi:hypothetical protein
MAIPINFIIARENAASLRKKMDVFASYFFSYFDARELHVFDNLTSVLLSIIHPYARYAYHYYDDEFIDLPNVLDQSISWLHTQRNYNIDEIREAKKILDDASEDWYVAHKLMYKLLNTKPYHLSEKHWIKSYVKDALSRYHNVIDIYNSAWPISDINTEEKMLHEMNEGGFVELDDAIASVAGLTKEQWLEIVANRDKNDDWKGELN